MDIGLFVDFLLTCCWRFVDVLLTFCWLLVDFLLTFCWHFVDLLRCDFCFLIQNQTFPFFYPRSDFPVFLSKIRLSGFLIQDQSFRFSYPRSDFPVFLSKIRLSGFLIQDKNLMEFMADIFWTFGDIWGHLGILGDILRHLGIFGDIWGHMGTCGDIGQIFADIRSMKVLSKIRIWRNAWQRRRRNKLILRPLRCTRSKIGYHSWFYGRKLWV